MTSVAIGTLTATQDIMHTDALTNLDSRHVAAYLFNNARNLMSQRPGQRLYRRFARSIVDIAVANACCPNAHQNIAFANWGHRDLVHLKGIMSLNQAGSFHSRVLLSDCSAFTVRFASP